MQTGGYMTPQGWSNHHQACIQEQVIGTPRAPAVLDEAGHLSGDQFEDLSKPHTSWQWWYPWTGGS
jgi:hypothetical protein